MSYLSSPIRPLHDAAGWSPAPASPPGPHTALVSDDVLTADIPDLVEGMVMIALAVLPAVANLAIILSAFGWRIV